MGSSAAAGGDQRRLNANTQRGVPLAVDRLMGALGGGGVLHPPSIDQPHSLNGGNCGIGTRTGFEPSRAAASAHLTIVHEGIVWSIRKYKLWILKTVAQALLSRSNRFVIGSSPTWDCRCQLINAAAGWPPRFSKQPSYATLQAIDPNAPPHDLTLQTRRCEPNAGRRGGGRDW